ncbi:MAG: hypothetical protein KZQ83_17755 [gamma proteobacterium symbiont of Taylorina sp.]|nr:hypothetical protein [gamma proteobacterium symbiont of Taylorina sp.]
MRSERLAELQNKISRVIHSEDSTLKIIGLVQSDFQNELELHMTDVKKQIGLLNKRIDKLQKKGKKNGK